MKTLPLRILTFIGLLSIVIACSKEEVDPISPGDKNNITLEFDNRVGSQKLALASTSYQNASGENFTVTTLNYFISNVSLKKADGTSQSFPTQYFLVRQADSNTLTPILKDVPAADYTAITFTIGVDSLKSASAVEERTGVLDIASYGDDNMYWSWNSGYIFFKLEGISSAAPANSAGLNKYQYHVGGYGGRTVGAPTTNNLRTVTLPLNGTATVRKSIAPTIHIIADVAKVFTGASNLKIASGAVIMSPTAAIPIANNYKSMFTVDHVHND